MSSFGTNRTLAAELKEIKRNGVEGFTVDADEDNILSWQVGIFGIPGTVYEGGYFKASLTFPQDYPFNPPKMKFDTFMYHPNVYTNGELCISILHPAIHDETSGESLNERWNPTQNVRTVLLSVISLLNEPNISSPANVDAAVAFRKWREGRDNEFEVTVKRQVAASKIVAEKEGIKVPLTQEDYCIKEKKEELFEEIYQIDDGPGYDNEEDFEIDDYGCDDDDDENDDNEEAEEQSEDDDE
ncbi:hypothetical protein L596_030547 [Steinernema carpocapsae]|uniref:UBC core domain-containing protein n=1 Tax=Steinernema carpocapsae TaxID=34508 RepID=A0A4U5LPR5_STECR|nr:hypothetical protein L596_030547 [Steinernema carpocapsae]